MRKIKQNAKQEWECLHNLKLLQNVFLDQGIKKVRKSVFFFFLSR
jgi:hypothetical protein